MRLSSHAICDPLPRRYLEDGHRKDRNGLLRAACGAVHPSATLIKTPASIASAFPRIRNGSARSPLPNLAFSKPQAPCRARPGRLPLQTNGISAPTRAINLPKLADRRSIQRPFRAGSPSSTSISAHLPINSNALTGNSNALKARASGYCGSPPSLTRDQWPRPSKSCLAIARRGAASGRCATIRSRRR
ncbi:hypothetical protein P3T21_006500 [Paraburkholderia sp. GAS334]|jgi:hypothetical protein